MKSSTLRKLIREVIKDLDKRPKPTGTSRRGGRGGIKATPLKGVKPHDPAGPNEPVLCYWSGWAQVASRSCTEGPVDTWGAAGPFNTIEECEENLFNATCMYVNCDDPSHPFTPYTPDHECCT